ncbi:hypothetical protein OXX69_001771 [Metschnikowia pulcherrima]
MKLLSIVYFYVLFSLGFAATTTTSSSSSSASSSSSVEPTTVWVTITTGGALATVQSIWVQSFMSTYSDATSSATSGSMGMGSLSGSVGGVRTYTQSTVNGGSALYSNSMALLVLFLNWVL